MRKDFKVIDGRFARVSGDELALMHEIQGRVRRMTKRLVFRGYARDVRDLADEIERETNISADVLRGYAARLDASARNLESRT